MQFETPIRISIAAMILLATLLLGVGDGSPTLTILSIAVVAVAVYVTDIKRWFVLSQAMANWAALLVMGAAAVAALRLDRHGLLIAAGELQSYLQYVLLFQPKTARVYWQLALLSLGQVAIGSTLVPGPMFGLVLLVYFFCGSLCFLMLLLSAEAGRETIVSFPVLNKQLVASLVGASPATLSLSGGMTRSQRYVQNSVEQATIICLSSALFTVLLFLVLPRWTMSNRQSDVEPLRTVGFTKKVTLGELGEVINNPELVMRISFFSGRGNNPIRLINEPLLRGTVVDRYENGSWTQTSPGDATELPTEEHKPFIRQHIYIEPTDEPEVCCVFPIFEPTQNPILRTNDFNDELTRMEEARTQSSEFDTFTNGIYQNKQREFVPCKERRRIKRLLQIPESGEGPDPFAGLKETAARALNEAGVDPADHVAAAHALNDYLHTSGQYSYSLEAQSRDVAVDPIEDFMTVHKAGHCEYFAGALVLMLRSQGIPARMAIGFKGGEWNPLGNYYQIQQLHAHSWVEVYLSREHLPKEEFAIDDDPDPPAAWLILDPTEGVQQGLNAERTGLLGRIRQIMDYGQVLWTNYVVGLNSKRQREVIYQPVANLIVSVTEKLFGRQAWQDRMAGLSQSPVGAFWEWYRRHWFDWRGGLVAIGFSLVLLVFYKTARWATGTIGRIGRGLRGDQGQPVLEMYRRLEAALDQLGLAREPSQTAHEFALAAGGELAETIEFRRLAPLPRRIVESFYRVRFGGRTLDNLEADSVEHALLELEHAAARPRQE